MPNLSLVKNFIKQVMPSTQSIIAYGSAVSKQAGYTAKSNPMIDIIVIVNDSQVFHEKNLLINASHYSNKCQLFGASYIQKLNNLFHPIHYNPYVQVDEKITIKYGVIEQKIFQEDLQNFNWITFAGRIHKPIEILDDTIDIQLQINESRKKAIAISLVLNGYQTDFDSLLYTIVNLSYSGDIRFLFGTENPQKMKNIITGNYLEFQKIYQSLLNELQNQQYLKIENDQIIGNQMMLQYLLPERFQHQDKNLVQKQIENINRVSSLRMISQHLFSTSFYQNIKYAGAKIMKNIKK